MEKEYFKPYDFHAPYLSDLLRGQIKIYDVPEASRTRNAYIYALRFARDTCGNKDDAYILKEIIKQQLLNDMLSAGQCKDASRYDELHHVFEMYFIPYRLNVYNSKGMNDICLEDLQENF